MTIICEDLFQDSSLSAALLIALYRGFVEKWHKKMNQLTFAKLSVRVAELLGKHWLPVACLLLVDSSRPSILLL